MATKAQIKKKWATYDRKVKAYRRGNPTGRLPRALRAERHKIDKLAIREFARAKR